MIRDFCGDGGMVIRPEQPTAANVRESLYAVRSGSGFGMGDKTGTQDWNGFYHSRDRRYRFDYSYLMAATADRVPCVFVENQRSSTSSERSDCRQLQGAVSRRTLGKGPSGLLTKLNRARTRDEWIVNGISIGI